MGSRYTVFQRVSQRPRLVGIAVIPRLVAGLCRLSNVVPAHSVILSNK